MRKKPRLSEFIKQKLKDGSIPGLVYTNVEQQIFRIPWKHGAKQGYEIEKDGVIYVEWAKVTNKYIKYSDKPNVWKTNFRCAINSLQDVKCLDDEHDKINGKLRSDKEYRVFQFITPDKKKISARTPRNTNKSKSHRQNTQSASLMRKKKKCRSNNKYQEIQSKPNINIDTNVGSVKTESESTEGSFSNSIDEQYHESNLPFPIGNPYHDDQIYVALPTGVVGPSIDYLSEFKISQDENQEPVYRPYDLPEPPYMPNTSESSMVESMRSNPEYQEILSELRPSDTSDDYRANYDRWYYGDNSRNYYALHPAYVQANVPACQGGC